MDCNTGLQLGRQLNKDAMLMHGGMHVDPALAEHDALMMGPPPGVVAPPGSDWSAAFAAQQQQQQQHLAMVRQQHEMEQIFRSQQQHQHQHQQQHLGTSVAVMNPMMAGVVTSGLGMGMMMPRMQYQPSMSLQQQSAPQTRQPVNLAPATHDSAWADQLSQQQWCQDYTDVQSFTLDGQKSATVEEMTKQSDFYSFMDRVSNRDLIIDEESGTVVAGPGQLSGTAEDTEHLRHLAGMEGISMPDTMFQRPPEASPVGDEYVRDPDMADNDAEEWAREYAELQERMQRATNNTDYPFEPNNPYVYHDGAFLEGVELLQLGNLAEAALAFEAACQANNDHLEAWKLLGTTQAENEKDPLAIIALNNARRLNPKDLEVHAALSVSHTNEHNTDAALASLKAWIVNHPEYEQLGSIEVPPDPEIDLEFNETFFFADPTRFREVNTLYGAAVEMNSNDARLFTNMGVLHNISHDFETAADSLRRAVALSPEDPKLWNKLGATLANGGKAEEAIGAYDRALDINPGYVRAMYNMAVAFSNMERYPQAAKQLVRAIAVQEGGTNPSGEGALVTARSIWDTLRMTLSLMDRQDLVELSHNQDLAPFIKEFGLEGLV